MPLFYFELLLSYCGCVTVAFLMIKIHCPVCLSHVIFPLFSHFGVKRSVKNAALKKAAVFMCLCRSPLSDLAKIFPQCSHYSPIYSPVGVTDVTAKHSYKMYHYSDEFSVPVYVK